MVKDAAIVGPGDGAQLDAAIFDIERLDLFGSVRGEALLEIDAGEWRRQLAEVGRRRANERGYWPKLQWVGAIG